MCRGAGGSRCLRTDDCSVVLRTRGAGSAAPGCGHAGRASASPGCHCTGAWAPCEAPAAIVSPLHPRQGCVALGTLVASPATCSPLAAQRRSRAGGASSAAAPGLGCAAAPGPGFVKPGGCRYTRCQGKKAPCSWGARRGRGAPPSPAPAAVHPCSVAVAGGALAACKAGRI